MRLVHCDRSYSGQILEIFNEVILNSTALYEYRARTPEMMSAWFEAKRKGNYPIVGAVTEDGGLMGFGTYGPFRNFPAYRYSVEHSIYVAASWRGQGLGKRLLQEVMAQAQAQDYHVLVGAIDSENTASIRLHRALGFQHAGTVRQAGFKFARWLDLEFYQLVLDTPGRPREDGPGPG